MAGGLAAPLRALLEAGVKVAHVVIEQARGSTPREAGAAMLVSDTRVLGTIGGGRLEWDAVLHARALLGGAEGAAVLEVPLGPAIGQCCGGHVRLRISRASPALLAGIEAEARAEAAMRPTVLLFGAGHVGRALAAALGPLPLRLRWIDSRADAFGPDPPAGIAVVVSADWQAELDRAPAGAACLVLTHSHALDSLIVAEALEHDDFGYVGLIGSRSKRAQFERGFRDLGLSERRIARLVCPIGGSFARDKRPEVIAAFVVAELLQAVLSPPETPITTGMQPGRAEWCLT